MKKNNWSMDRCISKKMKKDIKILINLNKRVISKKSLWTKSFDKIKVRKFMKNYIQFIF